MKNSENNQSIRALHATMYTLSTGKYMSPDDPIIDRIINDTKVRRTVPTIPARKNSDRIKKVGRTQCRSRKSEAGSKRKTRSNNRSTRNIPKANKRRVNKDDSRTTNGRKRKSRKST